MDMDTKNQLLSPGSGFLDIIAPPIRRYPYKSRAQFIESWKEEKSRQEEAICKRWFSDVSEWMLFTGVNQQTFTRDFLDPATPWTDITWCSFDKINSLLLVKMPKSRHHETAARIFSDVFKDAVEPTGLKYALRDWGSATTYGPSGAKEADCAWLPPRLPRGRSDQWPSVVVEVAFTEKLSKLMSDVRYWLGDSDGDVQLVITIKVDLKKPEITFETWEGVGAQSRRIQRIVVSKTGKKNISVDGSPLSIRFDKLFLRRPSGDLRERDITLNAASLELVASKVWSEQGF